MKIGELAKRTGFAESQIRYWERRGLLPPADRSGSGYRIYGEADVARLRLLGRAKLIGLPLAQAGELLEVVENGCCADTEPARRSAVERRIAEVDHQIGELRALRATLTAALAEEGSQPEAGEGCGGEFCLSGGGGAPASADAELPVLQGGPSPASDAGCCEPDCGPETCG